LNDRDLPRRFLVEIAGGRDDRLSKDEQAKDPKKRDQCDDQLADDPAALRMLLLVSNAKNNQLLQYVVALGKLRDGVRFKIGSWNDKSCCPNVGQYWIMEEMGFALF
jgi:hypothetical protein